MLAEKLAITLDKRYQKADWGERPLSKEMLNYARLDTHHLLDLRDSLQADLQQCGRWELACEEFTRLAAGNGATRADLPAWQRVKGTRDLNRQQLAILQELCSWRGAQAEHMRRPVFKVMDDKRLVSIALAAPINETDLEALNLTPRQIYVFGSDILKAVGRGKKAAPVHRPLSDRPDPLMLNRLNALSSWRKSAAQKMEVESDVVLPKPWMHAIAEQNPQNLEQLSALMPLSPWRLDAFGMQIIQALHEK
jgi:ribonuclease D